MELVVAYWFQTTLRHIQVRNSKNNDFGIIFLAPEIFLRLSPGYSSDFYSVGLILYQMMVGHVKLS